MVVGLSGVADFARNFAVMVKVQGSDPKGLKMRNHAFHHYNSGITTLSASGMLLPTSFLGDATMKSSQTLFVLTVASVIEPFLLQQYRQHTTIKEKPRLVPGAKIDILLEDKSMVEGGKESLPWVSAELLMLVDIPQTSAAVQSLIESSCGSSMENGWEVGWSLASHSRGSQRIMDTSHAKVEPIKPTLMGRSTSRIALLQIISKLAMDTVNLQACVPKRGEVIMAMGSPFGILSPLHFFNNISVGSIGNSYPPNSSRQSLLMADIRCLPGMEGSAVFNQNTQFVGILTRPLRQNISGTEIQLVIPWEAIAQACNSMLDPHVTCKGIKYNNGTLNNIQNILPEHPLEEFANPFHEQINQQSQTPSPINKAMSSICLITTEDGSWASGVLLNKKGLILTNAHLMEPWRFGKTAIDFARNETNSLISRDIGSKISGRKMRVRLDFIDPWMWTSASIFYISKGPLDIALLQLDVVPDQLCPIAVDFDCPQPGSKAYVIGHGLFGPRCDLLPSASLGVIAKVIKAKRSPQLIKTTDKKQLNSHEEFPAMLETTAAVHPGSSGGAVVNSDGCMIGLVTRYENMGYMLNGGLLSNAKHGGGTVIPHLNFSIPSAALEPILKFSADIQDSAILEELDKPNEHLSSVWALMPPLYPKTDPLLTEVPQFPTEDKSKEKEAKGSRFAKFMADRTDLLKKTPQPGTARRFNELTQSKL